MSDSSTDLKLLAAVTVLVTVPLTTGLFADSAVRILLGFPLLVVIPGYAVLTACVPSAGPISGSRGASAAARSNGRAERLSGVEWWALSIAISLLLVPTVTFVLIRSPLEYGTTSLGALLAFVSGSALVIGAIRRRRLPPDRRFRIDLGERRRAIGDAVRIETKTDIVLSLALVVAVVLLIGSGVYAMNVDRQEPDHTELFLLTENESGEYVASGYPSRVEAEDSVPLVLGIGNHEGAETEYVLVVQEQRLEGDEVVDRNRLRTLDATVPDGTTGTTEQNITPTAAPGESVRIAVLLYADEDDVPETPTIENAYRHAYFRTTIIEPTDGGGAANDSDEGEALLTDTARSPASIAV